MTSIEQTGLSSVHPRSFDQGVANALHPLENERRWKQPVEPRQQIDPAMPKALAAMQFSHVLIGTIVWWLESEKSYTPRQMAAWFWRFAFYGYLSTRGYEAPPPGKE